MATQPGRCRRHDEELGQLVALLQKLQARVDLADGSREGVTPGEECGRAAPQGGWRWWAPGLHSDTVFSGHRGAGGPCGGWHCGAPATPEEKSWLEDRVGQAESLWVSPRSWGRLQLGTAVPDLQVFCEWIEHSHEILLSLN